MENKKSQILQQNKILLGGQTINLRARQLVYVLGSMMDKNNPSAPIYINANDFLKFINNTSGEKWSDIYALVNYVFDHLNKNPILIKEPSKKDFVKINWLSRLGVVRGQIEARFSADIADFLVYKQGLPYTKLLWDLRPYKSSFTARIMDLFQKYHNKNSGIEEFEFEYELRDLKLFFGVHERYARFFDFEKRVLKTTEKELEENDLVPYWFNYEKIKEGRNVVRIKFVVYVRPEILLDLAPEIEVWTTPSSKDNNQTNVFESKNINSLSDKKRQVFRILLDLGHNKGNLQKILHSLSDSQAIGYCYLIEYGVNKSLAFRLLQKHCSFGEIKSNEHHYIKYTLERIERDRLKRIEEAKSGKTTKRTTPEDKRGGLPKKVLEERQFFSAFMEKLSETRRNRTISSNDKRVGETFTLSDSLNNLTKKD